MTDSIPKQAKPDEVKQDILVYLATMSPNTLNELTDGLAEVLDAVQETEKKGSITLTISIEPAKVEGMVLVTDAIKLVVPQPKRDPVGMFYVVNRQLADNPRGQQSIPFTGLARTAGGKVDGSEQA